MRYLINITVGTLSLILFGCQTNVPPRHIFLMVLDTLRADHVGAYGYERTITPTLDSFAQQSIKANFALTAAPWTPPSIGTMFTGLYASAHGMMPPNGRNLARKSSSVLDQGNETLAELFKGAGYQTAGITPNPWIKDEFGYNQGFDQYYFRDRARAEEINRATIKVLDSLDPDKPFFLFVHYLDPHDPYDPPPQYKGVFNEPLKKRTYTPEVQGDIDRYDGEINYLDTQLGALFEHLRKKNLWDDSIIVIVSDHGEQFRERGHQGHGFQLFNEELHVVFMVKAPGVKAQEINDVVSTVDVFPTILELASLPIPAQAQGISLLNEAERQKRIGILSEIDRKYNWRSITSSSGQRLILDFGRADEPGAAVTPRTVGLFDSRNDYYMQSPLTDDQAVKELTVEFDGLYSKVIQNQIKAKDVAIKQDTLKQLESLGYMK